MKAEKEITRKNKNKRVTKKSLDLRVAKDKGGKGQIYDKSV